MFKAITTSLIIVTSFCFSMVQNANAAYSFEDMYTNCGLGAMFFDENETLAAITNVTWDSGTTAISSGLSEAGCNGSKFKSAMLIIKKYAAIEVETASGSGEHLAALMDIYGCDIESQKVVLTDTREGFAKLVAAPTYSGSSQFEKAKAYHMMLDENITRSCAA